MVPLARLPSHFASQLHHLSFLWEALLPCELLWIVICRWLIPVEVFRPVLSLIDEGTCSLRPMYMIRAKSNVTLRGTFQEQLSPIEGDSMNVPTYGEGQSVRGVGGAERTRHDSP